MFFFHFAAVVPEFTGTLEDVTVPEHKDATMICELNESFLDVTWYHKDKPIKKSTDKYKLVKEGRVRKLIISDCTIKKDMGPVKVTSRKIETTAKLTVEGRPAWSRYFLKL